TKPTRSPRRSGPRPRAGWDDSRPTRDSPQIHRPIRRVITHRRLELLPTPNRALQAHLPHQPFHRAARDVHALAPELTPYLALPTHAEILPPHSADLDAQPRVALRSLRPPLRIHRSRLVLVVRRRGDRQLRADRLHPM